MPTYEFQCEQCQHYFTKLLKIDDREEPTFLPCPQCEETRIKRVMSSPPALGDSVRLGIRRPDDGFKEVLQKIHESTPGSKIKESSRYI